MRRRRAAGRDGAVRGDGAVRRDEGVTLTVVVLDDGHERLDRLVAALRGQAPDGSWDVLVCGAPEREAELARRCAPLGDRVRLVLVTGTSTDQLREASARAAGTWVTVCSSTTVFRPGYLEAVLVGLADGAPEVHVVTTHALVRDESRQRVSDSSPDRWRSGAQTERCTVVEAPDRVPAGWDGVLFEAGRFRTAAASLTPAPAPSVAGLELVVRYLLLVPSAVVLHVPEARFERSTPAGTGPTVASPDAGDARVYTQAWTATLLPTVRLASQHGPLPAWFRRLLLGEVFRRLHDDELSSSRSSSVSADALRVFHEAVASLAPHLEERDVWDFAMADVPVRLRAAVLFGYLGAEGLRAPRVSRPGTGGAGSSVRVEYWCRTALPESTLPTAVPREHGKSQSVRLLGRELVRLRSFWVRSATEVSLGGTTYTIPQGGTGGYLDSEVADWDRRRRAVFTAPSRLPKGPVAVLRRLATREITWTMIWEEISLTMPGRSRLSALARLLRQPVVDLVSQHLWRLPQVRARYDGGWVLTDRLEAAGDNAEHLARHLLHAGGAEPVRYGLERRSPDWRRLRSEGFDLVAPGTVRWNLALAGADVLASSHVDRGIVEPLSPGLARLARWRFVFLQHGVTVHDVSRWLNSKPIDLLITSAEAEREAIAGDGTTYRYSTREVALTGMPRFDGLQRARAAVTGPVRTVVVAPTWRTRLRDASLLDPSGHHLAGSRYWRAWSEVLSSPTLEALADAGVRVVLLPHPSMEPLMRGVRVPRHVEVASYRRTDVQQLLAQTRLLVTDYSSVAFDAAYVGADVVYYQFDRDETYSGGHLYREGYHDFETDGLGPVAHRLDEVLREVERSTGGGAPGAAGAAAGPAGSFFAWQDERSCERTVAAIRALVSMT